MMKPKPEALDNLAHLFKRVHEGKLTPEKATELFLRCYGGTKFYVPVYMPCSKEERLRRCYEQGATCREAAALVRCHISYAYRVFSRFAKESK